MRRWRAACVYSSCLGVTIAPPDPPSTTTVASPTSNGGLFESLMDWQVRHRGGANPAPLNRPVLTAHTNSQPAVFKSARGVAFRIPQVATASVPLTTDMSMTPRQTTCPADAPGERSKPSCSI